MTEEVYYVEVSDEKGHMLLLPCAPLLPMMGPPHDLARSEKMMEDFLAGRKDFGCTYRLVKFTRSAVIKEIVIPIPGQEAFAA